MKPNKVILKWMNKPRFFPKDTCHLFNDRAKKGIWEPCTILEVETIWHTANDYWHLYRVVTPSGGVRKNIREEALK